MLLNEQGIKGSLNELVGIVNSFEEMILGQHPEIL
jgi:hypothetical protein